MSSYGLSLLLFENTALRFVLLLKILHLLGMPLLEAAILIDHLLLSLVMILREKLVMNRRSWTLLRLVRIHTSSITVLLIHLR